MSKRRIATLAAATLGVCAVPAAAVAGAPGTAGTQSVQLAATVTPHVAGAQHVKLGIDVNYKSTDGTRITNATNAITLTLPAGMAVNVHAAPQCSYTKLASAKGDVSVCPKGSIIGGGFTVIDARPTLPAPVTYPIVAYNLKGQHNDVMIYIHTPYGNTYDFFNVLPGRRERLQAHFGAPANTSNSLYTLREVKLTLHDGSAGHSYVSAPKSCHRSWAFGIGISSYALAQGTTPPPVSASDAARCTAATS